MDLAFESAGFNIVGLCEKDNWCGVLLQQHFPNSTLHSDIKDLDGSLYEGVDIVITTPPCQPVSVAGTRKGDTDERW
jgi:DNA (cytosine-5)-methyltransferase 1